MLSFREMTKAKRVTWRLARWTNSSLVKNISKVYLGDVLSKVIAVGSMLLLIRLLSVSDYARYTAFSSIISLAPGIVGTGINLALVRFSAEYFSRTGRKPLVLYLVSFPFEVALFVLLLAVFMPLSDKVSVFLFGSAKFQGSFQYGLAAGLGMLLLQAGRSAYQAEERFDFYIGTLWLRQLLTLVVLVVLFLMHILNFRSVALAIVGVNLLVGVIVAYSVLKEVDLGRLKKFLEQERGLVKDFFSSTKWLIAYTVTLVAFGQMSVFVLSHFSTEEEVALYGVAFRYYSMALLLLGSIHAVLLPRFSKIDMLDVERQEDFIFRWLKYSVWIIIPLAAFALLGKPLFVWVNGTRYEKAFDIFAVFSFGTWLSLVFSPLVNVLMSRREFRYLFVLSVIALVTSLVGNYLLVPIWGGIGAACCTISPHALINIGAFIKIMRGSKIAGDSCSGADGEVPSTPTSGF